jgi:hypothetical protein
LTEDERFTSSLPDDVLKIVHTDGLEIACRPTVAGLDKRLQLT